VTLDIGHTPAQPGATSARGKSEYAFNKRFVGELAAALTAHGSVKVEVLNRAGGNVSLGRRAARIARLDNGIMLSIHHDSVQPQYLKTWTHKGRQWRYSDRFRGYSLFVSGRSPAIGESKVLALAIGGHLRVGGFAPTLHHAEKIRGENRPLIDPDAGLYRYDGLAILRTATIPAVLIEAGVIVNREEEQDLESRAYRARLIGAIVRGVASYCGLP
jgi:N-acetylmuramoyl-L-alanine amidase